ncbi:hypothetical protein [Zooshikella harenae]|uniref:Uncharacterized protein n=1 Tax=Zooshikella harenae TaxID=2827238 RepID=A0ABS5ZJU3_9GAMM|nr:hypothetical protein [Zooshikella harenae]MBU2713262.1 hypothetical protein [Zooshikella harenae]
MNIFLRNLSFFTYSFSVSLSIAANTMDQHLTAYSMIFSLQKASQNIKVPNYDGVIKENDELSTASNLHELSKLGVNQLKDECSRFSKKNIQSKNTRVTYLNKYLEICSTFILDLDLVKARHKLKDQIRHNAKLCNRALRDKSISIPSPFICKNHKLTIELSPQQIFPTLIFKQKNNNGLDYKYYMACHIPHSTEYDFIEFDGDTFLGKLNLNSVINRNIRNNISGSICTVSIEKFEPVSIKFINIEPKLIISLPDIYKPTNIKH